MSEGWGLMDASLHTGKMTYDEAVTFLADNVRFDRYAAARKAAEIAR